MSSYLRWTQHPETKHWHNAFWLDDYYGRHQYGVKFNDGKVFPAEQINNFVERKEDIPEDEIIDTTKDQSLYDSVAPVFEKEKAARKIKPLASGGVVHEVNTDFIQLVTAAVENAKHMTPHLQNAVASYLEYQSAPMVTIKGDAIRDPAIEKLVRGNK